MSYLEDEMDRMAMLADPPAAEMRAWGNCVHSVEELLALKKTAQEIAKLYDDIAIEAGQMADVISEDS